MDQNLDTAAKWLMRAATAGNVNAMLALGVAYSQKGWLSTNTRTSALWYKSAAALKNAEGLYQYALLRDLGIGIVKNRDEATQMMVLAAQLGHADARLWVSKNRNRVNRTVSKQ